MAEWFVVVWTAMASGHLAHVLPVPARHADAHAVCRTASALWQRLGYAALCTRQPPPRTQQTPAARLICEQARPLVPPEGQALMYCVLVPQRMVS
ncbi:MAG TPA: hypothetical protein VNK48_14325 [Xanthobacteraceae bacterium]|nr:hypothetical protein [Xanthobacteraceae bacterium]